jgi:phage-related protein
MADGSVIQGITVTFAADLSALTDAVASATSILQGFSSDVSSISSSISDSLSSAFSGLKDIDMSGVTSGVESVSTELTSLSSDADSAASSFSGLNDVNLGGVTSGIESVTSDIEGVASEIESATSTFSGLNDVDISNVASEIANATSDMTDLGTSATDTGEKISEATDNAGNHTSLFSNILGGVNAIVPGLGDKIAKAFTVDGAIGMARDALGSFKDMISDSISVAEQHQSVMSQTAQVVKSTGDASGMSAQELGNLATSLSHVTTFSNDTIQSGENLLLTFTGIGKDVLPATTKTMLDMAQAMGGDTKGAALMLGKALNDPTTGLSALTRVGVTFSTQEKDQIKTMMAHNDVVGAQNVMLKELQTEFGGSAEAAGKTFAGSLKILNNDLTDAKQNIGDALLPVLQAFTGFVTTSIMPAVKDFSNALSSQGFKDFASNVGKNIADVLKNIGDFITSNVSPAVAGFLTYLKSPDFKTFADNMKSLGTQIASVVSGLKPSGNSSIFTDMGPALKTVATDIGDFAKGLADVIKWFKEGSAPAKILEDALIGIGIALGLMKIGEFVAMLPGLITGIWGWAAAQGAVAVETLITAAPYIAIGAIVVGIIALVVLAVQHWGDITKWLTGVWDGVSKWFQGFWSDIVKIFGQIGKWFQDRWTEASKGTTSAFGSVGKWFEGVWKGIQDATKAAWDFIVNAVKVGAKLLLDVILGPWIAIGELFIWLYNHNTYVKQLVDAIVGFFKDCFTWLKGAWSEIVSWLAGVWQNTSKTAADLWKQVSSAITAAVKVAWDWIVNAWNTVSKWLQDAWNTIAKFATDLWNKVSTAVHDGWVKAVDFVTGIWNQISAVFTNAWNTYVSKPLTTLWTNISNIFSSAWNTYISKPLSDIWTSISKWFTDLGTHASDSGKNFIKMLVDGITSGTGSIWNAVVGIANTIWKALGFHSPAAAGPGADADKWMPNLVNMLSDGMNSNVGKIQSASSNIISNIATPLGKLGSSALTWSTDMMNNFVNGILAAVNATGNAVAQIASKIAAFLHFSKPDTGALANSDTWMPDFGNMLSTGITNSVNKVQNSTTTLVSGISSNLSKMGATAANSAANFINMLVNGINSGTGSIWNAVVNIANTIWKALGFHSPAKACPGADADKWMPNLTSMLSNGLNSGVGQVQSASNNLASSIKTALGKLGTNAQGWSTDMINQFVKGILSGVGAVGNAAAQIAKSISANLHFSKPDTGPMVDVDKWMPDFGNMLSSGLIANQSKIQSAAKTLANSISVSLNPSTLNANINYAALAGSKAIQASTAAQPITVQVTPNDVYIDGTKVTDVIATRFASMIRMKGNVRGK